MADKILKLELGMRILKHSSIVMLRNVPKNLGSIEYVYFYSDPGNDIYQWNRIILNPNKDLYHQIKREEFIIPNVQEWGYPEDLKATTIGHPANTVAEDMKEFKHIFDYSEEYSLYLDKKDTVVYGLHYKIHGLQMALKNGFKYLDRI